MTINPESVKAYARELLEAEERGRREVNAELLAALQAAERILNEVIGERTLIVGDSSAYEVQRVVMVRRQCVAAIRKAERQGEALEVEAGNRGTGG